MKNAGDSRVPKQAVGKRIRDERNRLRMTQERLAQIAELDRKHISSIETGKIDPGTSTLIRIAGALGMPMESLVAGLVFVPSEDSPGHFELREG
jgi:transcriptional regulator with XRE-family HTH domain